jgi:spore coat polysaccharide biosynthesis protein SpsF
MKTVATIEARMGSTRLPAKTLLDVVGQPLLQRVIDRIALARSVDEIVVATSTGVGDDAIASYCEALGVACFRGSEDDVLDRVWRAAQAHAADIVVQLGADCPFYDPELIDLLVGVLRWGGYAYAANDMTLTFPEGVDAHVMTFAALEASAREARDPREREDTPRFIWNHPDRFPIFNLEARPGSPLNRPDMRLTVDYPEDIDLARRLYAVLRPGFSTLDLVATLAGRPDWIALNAHCEQRSAAYV